MRVLRRLLICLAVVIVSASNSHAQSIVQCVSVARGSGGTGTFDVPITATGAGRYLLAKYGIASGATGISITATGGTATFVVKINVTEGGNGTGQQIAGGAFNIGAGVTTVTLNYTGFNANQNGTVCEISGVATASDPWDVAATWPNPAFGTTDLGTGSITTTAAGFGVAIFQDFRNAATAYTPGTGWTAGTTTANQFYETRSTSASTAYGGTSGQATATTGGASGQPDGFIVSLKLAAAGTVGSSLVGPATLVGPVTVR
jgi:hypothetical protein